MKRNPAEKPLIAIIPYITLTLTPSGYRQVFTNPSPEHVAHPQWKCALEALNGIRFGHGITNPMIQRFLQLLAQLIGISLLNDLESSSFEPRYIVQIHPILQPNVTYPSLQVGDIANFHLPSSEISFTRKQKKIIFPDGSTSLSPPPGYCNADEQWNAVLWAIEWVHGLIGEFIREDRPYRRYRLISAHSVR